MWIQEIHDVVAGPGPLRPLHEGFQQVDLAGRQLLLLLAAHACEAPTVDVQDPTLEGVPVPCARGWLCCGAAPQHRADARYELPQLEGFGEIVVCPQLEPDDAVDGIAPAGQHDDRDVVLLPDLPRQVEAVFLSEAEVQRDEADRAALEAGPQLGPVFRNGHDVALAFKAAAKKGPDLRVVIDDKNVCSAHRAAPIDP